MTAPARPRDWLPLAACRDADPALFFPAGDPASPAVARKVRKALKVCSGCPVRAQCLALAVDRPENWGIWGGTTPDGRAASRRRRMRGAAA